MNRLAWRSVASPGSIRSAVIAVLLTVRADAAGVSGKTAFPPANDVAPDEGCVVGPLAAPLESKFPHACGVFLAEVTEVSRHDERPTDGDLFEDVGLRTLRGTGTVLTDLSVVIASSEMTVEEFRAMEGRRPPSRAKPRFAVQPGSLAVGDRYWFVTASEAEGEWYPQRLMRCWRADRRGVPDIVPQAVEHDAYRWHPEFHPDPGLTVGWSDDSAASVSRIRVWSGKRLLWQRITDGPLTHGLVEAWGLLRGDALGDLGSPELAGTAWVVLAESRVALDSINSFGLRARRWRIQELLDARTGTTLAARVRADIDRGVERVYQAYDPRTGAVVYERIQDLLRTGGKVVGAPEDSWLRRVERWIDPRTGRIQREEVRRFAQVPLSAYGRRNDWLKVDHDLGLAAGPPKKSSGP